MSGKLPNGTQNDGITQWRDALCCGPTTQQHNAFQNLATSIMIGPKCLCKINSTRYFSGGRLRRGCPPEKDVNDFAQFLNTNEYKPHPLWLIAITTVKTGCWF